MAGKTTLRTDGLVKVEGAHAKTKRNPKGGGMPSTNQKYIDEALEKGENPNPTGKFIQMRKQEDLLEQVTDTGKQPARGMYSGETPVEEYAKLYTKVANKKYKGRPWTFPDAESLEVEVSAYFSYYLERRIPVSVAGLAFWLGITTATLKNWQKNQDTMPFYPVIEPALAFIQSLLEQGAIEGRVMAVPFIFIGKNYFGMTDTVNMEIYSSEKLTAEDKQKIIDNLPKDVIGTADTDDSY